jgi:hypothetical protein
MSLAASFLGATKTIPVNNRRIVRVGFRATPWLPLVIRSMQCSRAVQAAASATKFCQISIALSQKLKQTLVRQVALAAFLSVYRFHTLRRREKPPRGKPPRGYIFSHNLRERSAFPQLTVKEIVDLSLALRGDAHFTSR